MIESAIREIPRRQIKESPIWPIASQIVTEAK